MKEDTKEKAEVLVKKYGIAIAHDMSIEFSNYLWQQNTKAYSETMAYHVSFWDKVKIEIDKMR